MNLVTPWTPSIILGFSAALIVFLRRRLGQTWLLGLVWLGLGAAGTALILLRLSPDTAPAGFPWPSALGAAPQWAADSELFPHALILLFLAAGSALAWRGAPGRLAAPLLLAACTFLFLFTENLPALTLSWLALEALLLLFKRRTKVDAKGRGLAELDGFWGILALTGLAFAWAETQGASLRAYGAGQWSERARWMLTFAAFIRVGAYPLVSRGTVLRQPQRGELDAFAVFPVVAGLALAERAALLGPNPFPALMIWLGTISALVCGFASWSSQLFADRMQWALRAALGLVVMLWGAGALPPLLLFPSASAAIGLGFGLCALRPPIPSAAGVPRQALRFILRFGPAAVLGFLAPLAYGMLALWQRLLGQSLYIPILLGMVGQALLIASLLRPVTNGDTAHVHRHRGWAAAGIWILAAAALAFWPGTVLWLAGYKWSEVASGFKVPPAPGIWAAMLLPVLGGIVLPPASALDEPWDAWASRVRGFLALDWARDGVAALAGAAGWMLRMADHLLNEAGYLPWAIAFLIGLAVFLTAA